MAVSLITTLGKWIIEQMCQIHCIQKIKRSESGSSAMEGEFIPLKIVYKTFLLTLSQRKAVITRREWENTENVTKLLL